MLICKLTISYDRGLARNDEKDLAQEAGGVLGRGATTADGKIIRGLGTHFRSKEDADLVGERDKEARRIYRAFRERFLTTPIDGLYAVPEPGVAASYLDELNVQLGLKVRVTEFALTTNGDLDAAEIAEWSRRVKNQLIGVQLGRKKDIDENGLSALATLANCPVISQETKTTILNLVEGVRTQKVTRVELKRNLEKLDVKLDAKQLSPRRAPKIAEEVA